MDWNGDGKHDWEDDAFFHEVILKEEEDAEANSNASNNNGNTYSSNFAIFGEVFGVALIFAIFFNFIIYGSFGTVLGIGAIIGLILQIILG